jgi:hypothetical protein
MEDIKSKTLINLLRLIDLFTDPWNLIYFQRE